MSRPGEWAPRVLALIRSGNVAAAVNQIKVAPTVKDLRKLEKLLAGLPPTPSTRDLTLVLDEQIALQSAPRLHRAP